MLIGTIYRKDGGLCQEVRMRNVISNFTLLIYHSFERVPRPSTRSPKRVYILFMLIEQTVEVPENHQLTIEVPREVPAGPTVIVFRPVAESSRGMTAQEAIDRGLGFGDGPRIDPMEAIERCAGLAKRLGINLSSDEFLEMRRQERELEDRLDKRLDQ